MVEKSRKCNFAWEWSQKAIIVKSRIPYPGSRNCYFCIHFWRFSEVEIWILEVEVTICVYIFEGFGSRNLNPVSELQFLHGFLKVFGSRTLNPGSRHYIFFFLQKFWRFSEVEISILEIEITIFAMVLLQLDVSCMVPLFVQVRKQTIQKLE